MRIAILTRQIGHYHDARYRGAAKVFGEVVVISLANEGGFKQFVVEGSGSYRTERLFEGREDYRQAVASGEAAATVRRTLARLQPEAVAVAGWASAESFAAIGWARENRVPLVMMSESQGDDAGRFWMREAIKRLVVSLCDACLVGGPPHRDYMVRLGLPTERVFLGYNAVSNAHFAQGADAARADAEAVRRKHDLPDRYVLASARFIPKKNLPALVEAYGRARARLGHNVPHLVILGDGDMRRDVEIAITRHTPAGSVHLPGFRGYDVLPAFYGLSDGFAHVSTVEQWGLVVNEAMAAGVPVVVSSTCGVARTVVGVEHGWMVNPHDVGSIAQGLEGLMRLAPDRRREMGEAARTCIANWGPERFGQCLRAAADSALEAPSRGPLTTWKRLLLGTLAHRSIEAVS